MHHILVSWHKIPLELSSWIIMLWTKRAHQNTSFYTFVCFNEISPNSSCQFWNHQVKVYSNFTSLFNVMKDNSSVFFLAQTFIRWTKSNFQTLEWLGKKSPNTYVMFETTSQFFLKTLHHSSASWEITLLYFFSRNCTWFGQKDPIKVQNIRLSTAHVKFH